MLKSLTKNIKHKIGRKVGKHKSIDPTALQPMTNPLNRFGDVSDVSESLPVIGQNLVHHDALEPTDIKVDDRFNGSNGVQNYYVSAYSPGPNSYSEFQPLTRENLIYNPPVNSNGRIQVVQNERLTDVPFSDVIKPVFTVKHNDVAGNAGPDKRQVASYLASKLRTIEKNPGPRIGLKKVKVPKKLRKVMSKPVVKITREAPSAFGYTHIQNSKMKKTTIRHCEQLQEIAGYTGSYSLAYSFPLNPGMTNTFPWLSAVAQQYEAYEFKAIKVHFMPYVSSATAGYVAINVDYDPSDTTTTEFPNKQSFCDYDGAVQGNCWEVVSLNVKCPNPEGPKRRSTRFGALSGNFDLHNYDHGVLNIAVGSQASTANIGTMYIEYVIDFYRPTVNPTGAANGYARASGSTSCSTTAYLGTSVNFTANNIGVSISNNAITFGRVGRYVLWGTVDGTTMVANSDFTAGANAQRITGISSGILNSAATTYATTIVIMDILAVNGVVNMAFLTSAASVSQGRIIIAQIPSSLSVPRPITEEIEELKDRLDRLTDELVIRPPSPTPSVLSSSMSSLTSSNVGSISSQSKTLKVYQKF